MFHLIMILFGTHYKELHCTSIDTFNLHYFRNTKKKKKKNTHTHTTRHESAHRSSKLCLFNGVNIYYNFRNVSAAVTLTATWSF